MSRNPFTIEQVQLLSQNPYTYNVNRLRLSFTKEFKEIFYSEYQAGELPRQILADHSYDPVILGARRIWGISCHIREQYEKYGGFHEGPAPPKTMRSASASDVPATEKDELKQLRHEVDYLKQEVEFLKKIPSVRTIRK